MNLQDAGKGWPRFKKKTARMRSWPGDTLRKIGRWMVWQENGMRVVEEERADRLIDLLVR